MPRLRIDGREVEVEPGATVLQAARKLGIEIPTLCHRQGLEPHTACLVCLVRVNGSPTLSPSCARPAEEGMEVESQSEAIRAVRRMTLELLLSDHIGDCVAPCHHTCPAHMEIPLMLRQVGEGQLRAALATIKKDIALPAVLGRVCPEVCERTCRRSLYDHPASICMVKRFVADDDLASPEPFLPEKRPPTGRGVAVVGAGPAGLAAAYYLALDGHAVTLLDAQELPGGTLRYAVPEEKLPRAVLDAEIAGIARLGVRFRMRTRLGRDLSLDELRQQHDAVFLATGELQPGQAAELGLAAPGTRLPADLGTLATALPGVFAGGDLVRRRRLAVRSIADGKIAAEGISRFLEGQAPRAASHACASRAGRLERAELQSLIGSEVSREDRQAPAAGGPGGFDLGEARLEALRCLHCDCRKKEDCGLRDFSEGYGAEQGRFRGTRRVLVPLKEGSQLIFEAGKCIACGLCIQIAQEGGEALGLAFLGRGFNLRVGVPFDRPLGEGLTHTAQACLEACPTGALALASRLPEPQPWEKK